MLQFFVIIQWIGIAILCFEIIYLLYRKPSNFQVSMLIMEISTLLLVIGYLLELESTTVDEAMAAVKIGYVGKPFAMLAVLVFTLQYSRIKIPKWFIPLCGALNAITILAVFTNEYHHLYYTSVDFVTTGNFPHLELGHGPIYYIYMVLLLSYFIGVAILSIVSFKNARTSDERHQIIYIFALVGASGLGLVLYLSNVTAGYDTTVPACVICSLFMILLMFKYNIYDYLTYAKNQALDNVNKGIIILDNNNYDLYHNRVAEMIFPDIIDEKKKFDIFEKLINTKDLIKKEDRLYSIVVSQIKKVHVEYGKNIEIIDVTSEENYNEMLKLAVHERTKMLEEVQDNIIISFANMVEARDDATGSHIKHTSTYVKYVADELLKMGVYKEINEKYIDILVSVAPLHDLGKIAISDTVLRKPGKLTKDEFEIIKTHSEKGAELIEENLRGVETDEYVSMAIDVALFHHEKWNGLGYPRGLKETEIPLSARIMAIADVFDALISKRCYKDAFELDEAVSIILEGKGSHFDPYVVDAFMQCLDKIKDDFKKE